MAGFSLHYICISFCLFNNLVVAPWCVLHSTRYTVFPFYFGHVLNFTISLVCVTTDVPICLIICMLLHELKKKLRNHFPQFLSRYRVIILLFHSFLYPFECRIIYYSTHLFHIFGSLAVSFI